MIMQMGRGDCEAWSSAYATLDASKHTRSRWIATVVLSIITIQIITHHHVGGAPPAWAGAAATMQLPAPVSSFENLLMREFFPKPSFPA